MSYRTLAELEADIRYRYDIEGFTSRHPQVNIIRLINDAYRTLRDRLTSDGSMLFVTSTEATQSTIGRTIGYPGTILSTTIQSFPSFTIVHEVHCLVGSSWVPLAHRHLMDALTDTDNSTTGVPQGWTLVGLSGESGPDQMGALATKQEQRILILPSLDTARTFRVLGVKSWEDITASTDHLYTDMGLWDYVMAEIGLVIAMRDDDVQLYKDRLLEKDQVYKDIKHRALMRAPAAARRVDVRRKRVR